MPYLLAVPPDFDPEVAAGVVADGLAVANCYDFGGGGFSHNIDNVFLAEGIPFLSAGQGK